MKFPKNRLEAFTNGVMAIIVTIMVLYIPLPNTFGLAEIERLLASILVFFVSFFVVGLYWLQHYRLMAQVEEVTTKAGWRNLLFLFCLALLPLFTKWVIDNFGEVVPAVGYAVVFILVNLSYQFMFSSMLDAEDKERFRSAGIYSWWRIALWGAIIVGAVVLSVFSPRVATIVLIGLPLVGSLSNLLFEPQPRGVTAEKPSPQDIEVRKENRENTRPETQRKELTAKHAKNTKESRKYSRSDAKVESHPLYGALASCRHLLDPPPKVEIALWGNSPWSPDGVATRHKAPIL